MKFKQGDQIEPIEPGRGFDRATVISIFTETKGVHKGKTMYRLKIMNGIATIPIEAEVCYQLSRK